MEDQKLAEWLKAITDRQEEQNKTLKKILSVANFFFVMAILGFILGACSVLF